MVLCLCLFVPIHSFGDRRLRVVAVYCYQRSTSQTSGLWTTLALYKELQPLTLPCYLF